MATILTVSIANDVFEEIEKTTPANISRSEYVEFLIRKGLKNA